MWGHLEVLTEKHITPPVLNSHEHIIAYFCQSCFTINCPYSRSIIIIFFLKILKLKLNTKVNNIDQENRETSVHQANYTFTHVWINKHFRYYNLQCDSFSKQDTYLMMALCGWNMSWSRREEFLIVSEELHWRLNKVYMKSTCKLCCKFFIALW
jgi:hypothetical protein